MPSRRTVLAGTAVAHTVATFGSDRARRRVPLRSIERRHSVDRFGGPVGQHRPDLDHPPEPVIGKGYM